MCNADAFIYIYFFFLHFAAILGCKNGYSSLNLHLILRIRLPCQSQFPLKTATVLWMNLKHGLPSAVYVSLHLTCATKTVEVQSTLSVCAQFVFRGTF